MGYNDYTRLYSADNFDCYFNSTMILLTYTQMGTGGRIMKRWICFVCLVALCVFAISCQKEASIDSVSIDQCIYYADDFLKKASENTEFYKFEGDYNDLVNAYVVLMSVDEDYIVSLVNSMDVKEDYRSVMTAITLNNHDSNYDAIESAITDIKS